MIARRTGKGLAVGRASVGEGDGLVKEPRRLRGGKPFSALTRKSMLPGRRSSVAGGVVGHFFASDRKRAR
jgi:hypothetical protein